MKQVLLLFFAIHSSVFAQTERTFQVIDTESNEPVPYASVRWKKLSVGTVTNPDGTFKLTLEPRFEEDSVEVSSIGYGKRTMAYQELLSLNQMQILLEPQIVLMEEVTITPLSAEDLIRKAVESIPVNYPSKAYSMVGYFSDFASENDRPLSTSAVLYKGVMPGYRDTVLLKPEIQLLQAQIGDGKEVLFLKEKREKQARKSEKKGKESDELITIGHLFGNPANALYTDPVRSKELFFDEEKVEDFKYFRLDDLRMGDRTLMVIQFKSRGKVDNERTEGKVFIDQTSDAVVKLEYTSELIIPLIAKPILAMFGIGIENPILTKTVRYRPSDSIWVMEMAKTSAEGIAKEKHFFTKNEEFTFKFNQIAINGQVFLDTVIQLDTANLFKQDLALKDQLPERDETLWQEYGNLIP